jgi:hypothetical protein
MRRRELQGGDLFEFLKIHLKVLDMHRELKEATKAWDLLIISPAFRGMLVECESSGKAILGFGASTFVSDSFAKDEISKPRRGLNGRIIDSLLRGGNAILSKSGIADENTHGGLNVVTLSRR